MARAEGFEDWYRDEHPRLVATVALVTGDVDVAAESADEACARALAQWGRVGSMASPGGWAYQVALNVARRRFRRAALERRLLHRHPAPVASVPPESVELWDVVRGLPERQRTAVALRYIADMAEADIAVAMGVSRGTVASTLASARHQLVHLLDDGPADETAVRLPQPLEVRHV